ncbi:MAG: hypothetical protein ACI4AK_00100 [Lepagella sp.]
MASDILYPHYNDPQDPDTYVMEEDDDSLYNLDDADIEEDDTDPDEEESKSPKKSDSIAFLFFLRILATPVEGWKKLRRRAFKNEEVAASCFYPLVALAAFSEVADIFYDNRTISDWAVYGLVTFLAFFFGYFTILLLCGFILPKKSRDLFRKNHGMQLVMMALSSLAIFYTLSKALPMVQEVIYLLPLWTIYIIYKGVRVMRVNQDVVNMTTVILCILILGVPILWGWAFHTIFLPHIFN